MLDKKYLVTNGCSFTEGHMLGLDGAWPKFLGEKLNLEVVNLAKGGSGNDTITWRTLEFCEVNKDTAKDSIFVIQLSECLRYQVYYDDMTGYPQETHLTPLCFAKAMPAYKTGNKAAKWIYKNRNELIYTHSNITFSLYKTFQNIITLTSYFESKGYPYIIFDGINDHKPVKYNGSFYLKESRWGKINEEFKIKTYTDDFERHIIRREEGYLISENMIDTLFDNKYMYKEHDSMLQFFLDEGKKHFDDEEFYFKGNSGHPNLEACDIWADVLKNYIEKTFGKTE